MKSAARAAAPMWFSAGVGIFLILINRPLLAAWLQDPSCQTAPLAFLVWLFPVAGELLRKRLTTGGIAWMSTALLIGAAGSAGELQVIKQAALGMWISGFLLRMPARWIQWSFAVSWMPAWGWISHRFLHIEPSWSRPVLALAGLVLVAVYHRSKTNQPVTE